MNMYGRLDYAFRHPAERQAWKALQNSGHTLLRHNFHIRRCEIDLITATQDSILHIIEVKERNASYHFIHPMESIAAEKQRCWQQAVRIFLQHWEHEPQEINSLLGQAGLDKDLNHYAISFDMMIIKPADTADTQTEFLEGIL